MFADTVRNLLTAAREFVHTVAGQDEGRFERTFETGRALTAACNDMEEALRRQKIQAEDDQHKLKIFATHITTLVTADVDAKFGLSFWGGVYVDVEVEPTHEGKNDPTWNSYYFTINGKREHVGNRHGACQRYAQLCAPAFSLHPEKKG